MEESKELQGFYKIFRAVVYISLLMEFFAYALEPEQLDFLGGLVTDIHGRIKRWMIYHDGNLVWSKIATILLICITCIGTRNKKHLEFDARRQVLYPLVGGLFVTILSIWLFGHRMDTRFYTITLNIWLYMAASILGTVCIHVALDNISKFLKEGLLKDRFNFENESFEQCQELQENKYSVNIPMRYYYKGKFRRGWVNIVNPFRGTGRTEGVIFVRLIHWLKLNVNHLKSAIWAEQKKKYQKIRKGMTSGRLGTWLGNHLFYFPKFPKKTALLDVSNSTILFPTVG